MGFAFWRAAVGTVLLLLASALVLPGSARAQFSDNKIKIGVLDDFSGQYCVGDCMGPVTGVKLAIEDFGGKIDGVPIEMVYADHQNKPDVGVSIANKWYDTEQVDVIVDVVNSAVALAVQEIARSKGKAVLYSEAGSADLTGPACAPYSAQWTYDTYQFGKSIGEAVPRLGKTWFIIAADYAFGKGLAASVQANVEKAGGKVLGTVFHPFGAQDLSSFILQAQNSKAEVVALANAGGDMYNSVKAAHEFGLVESGVKLVPLSLDLPMIPDQGGLQQFQDIIVTLPWYRGVSPAAEALAKRFDAAKEPAQYLFAGLYSAVHHYLSAIKATGTDDPKAVFAWMQKNPVQDGFTSNGVLRPDGRMVHDVYLVQIKKPSESTGPNDLAKLITTIPGDKAFRPMDEGGCSLVAKKG
ncbi:MAG TPA: ABC transporter substrate-binding protein [Stellaceae bacterium]|jgi:branched-chain amino acid transport system substrate-binding protein